MLKGAEEDLLQARELLARATTRDPQFALAHSALAATYVTAAIDGFERPADAWPLANVSNRRALALDAELPEAHANRQTSRSFPAGTGRPPSASLRSRPELRAARSQRTADGVPHGPVGARRSRRCASNGPEDPPSGCARPSPWPCSRRTTCSRPGSSTPRSPSTKEQSSEEPIRVRLRRPGGSPTHARPV